MRVSELFFQTLREAPSEARLPGYQYLLRGGFVRVLFSGSHSFLPLGVQTRHRIEEIVRRALAGADGQEISLPQVQLAELWRATQVLRQDEARVPRFRDRGQREMVLGTSHEAAVLTTVSGIVQSYRHLPVLLYQAWQTFRDRDRTVGGLLGAREERVVDAYSLHADAANLGEVYARIQDALVGVFGECDVPVIQAAADVDEGGVVTAHKLVFPLPGGEETIVRCRSCGYAADQNIASARKEPPAPEEMLPRRDVETPHCKTIAELADFLGIPAARTAKAVFMVAGFAGGKDRFVFAIVRGDTDLNEEKLRRVLKAETVGPATEAEIRAVGAEPGYGSPVGLEGVTVVVDELAAHSPNLVAGANRPGYHALNVNLGRDYQATIVADITQAKAGSRCPECGAPLEVVQGVEVAASSKIGDVGKVGATYLDRQGKAQPMIMGRYRFYTDRVVAAVVENHHDERGLLWPAAVAPYAVYLMTVGKVTPEVSAAAERVYAELNQTGISVLYDDRAGRAGVKFNDADLLGLPLRVVVGDRGLKQGIVELKRRDGGDVERVALEDLVSYVSGLF